jgi:TonB-linked SusC/RagA family outer membrane protein
MRKLLLLLGVVLLTLHLNAQQKTITGTVTDATGKPIAGASVLVKGSSIGTTTKEDGTFSITAPATAKILIISSVGNAAEEYAISGKTVINAILKSADKALDEVVVVAYGTVKKENFTGSANRIKGADIAARPLSNVGSAIVGAAPGVQTNAGSGQPGSSPAVRIRGFGSVSSSNDPLYVVDGVPFSGNIANLNTNDIEDLTILKDASSTALYGARAANGVVMITTRKGRKGAKPTVSLSYSRGVTDRAIAEYDRVDAFQYYSVMWEAYRNSLAYRATNPLTLAAANTQATADIRGLLGYNPFNVANNAIVGTDGKLNAAAQLNYKPEDLDWEKSIRRLGQRQDVNLNISGGQEKTDYFISLGYLEEKGYIIRADFKRITGRINVNTQVAPWFKTGLNLSGTFTKSNQASSTGTTAFVNPFQFTRSIGPIYPIYAYDPANPTNYLFDASGNRQYDYGNLSALGIPNRPGGASGGRHITAETELNQQNFDRNFWGARTYGEFTFLKDFKFTTNISVDITNRNDLNYGNKLVGDAAPNGSLSKTTQTITSYNLNQLLAYTKKLGNHNFDALLGHENYDLKAESFSASRTNQVVSGNYNLVNFSVPGTSTSTTDVYRLEGFFSRLNYNYDNKYYAGVSFRRDGTSRFDKDSRWGNFWSASAAWRLDKENFLSGNRVISGLKIRASYGQTGNDDLLNSAGNSDYYPFQPLFTLGFNNALEPGIIQGSLGNPDLEWEASKQADIAVEFGLFKNRINGTLEFFNRVSDNLLFNVPLPLSSGVITQSRNVGSMYNRGIELNLNADVIKWKGFTWNVDINLTKLKNRITKLPQEEIITGTKKLKVGYSLYDYWLREWQGVDPADGAALYRTDVGTLAGSRIRKTGDTVTTNQNNGKFRYNGSAIPDYYGSMTNTFIFKGVELSILTTFQKGGMVYDVTYAGLMDPGNYGASVHVDALKAWKQAGDVTTIPRMDAGQRGISNAASDRWLTDASFINIRNMTLAYTFSNNIIERLKVRSIRFNVTGENLFISTKRKGMNVEESFTGVTSQAFIPQRIISAGLNITF